MKIMIMALLLLFSNVTNAQDVDAGKHRNVVLSGELELRLTKSLALYRKCVAPQKKEGTPEYAQLTAYEQKLKSSKDAALQPFERSLALLELDSAIYREENSNHLCNRALKVARFNLEKTARKTFIPIYPVITSLYGSAVIKDLDPNCVLFVTNTMGMGVDGNPCFAGAKIILSQAFPSFGPEFETRLDAFEATYNTLGQTAAATPNNSVFDPQSATRLDPKELIKLITLASTFSTSINGDIGPYGLLVIRKTWQAGGDAMTAYKRFMRLKNVADLNARLREVIKKRNLQYRFLDTDIRSWNRHNWMSASLSLYYEAQGQHDLAVTFPIWLGKMYEAKDAISHLEEGVSIEGTIDNFNTDTHRYVAGVNMAKKLF